MNLQQMANTSRRAITLNRCIHQIFFWAECKVRQKLLCVNKRGFCVCDTAVFAPKRKGHTMINILVKLVGGIVLFIFLLFFVGMCAAIFKGDTDESEPEKPVKVEATQEKPEANPAIKTNPKPKSEIEDALRNRNLDLMSLEELNALQDSLSEISDALWEKGLYDRAQEYSGPIATLGDVYIKKRNKQWDEDAKAMKELFFADGSYYPLVEATKRIMNDPRSFEHVRTTRKYLRSERKVQVKMFYRGKNVFGGVVLNCISAEFTAQGGFIKELSCE